jgi:hypothetical protein
VFQPTALLSVQGAGKGIPQTQEFAGTFLQFLRVTGISWIPRKFLYLGTSF